jgi:kumamolisin
VGAATAPPVTLPGHVLSNLATFKRTGAVAADQVVTLTIALRPASPQALDQAIAVARSQPGLSSFSATTFGQKYGLPQSQIDAVAAFFQSAGFSVAPAASDHLTMRVSGTAAQVDQALAVALGSYVDANGHSFFATDRDPTVPASVGESIQAIYGLDTYPALRPLNSRTQGSAGGFVPKDMQTAYNVAPLYTGGFNGSGQTIAILGCDSFLLSDVQAFQQLYQIPPASSIPITTIPNGPLGAGSSNIEGTLDLEWASAIATGASLHYYAFDCSFTGLLNALTQVVQDNTASVVSISLGACESSYSSTNYLQPLENELAAAASLGQGVFVASGDSGANCQLPDGSVTFGVSYPASSAFVTAIGGTTLQTTLNSTYLSETAWGSETDCGSPCGSGGGISGAISEPSWQVSASIGSTNGKRGLPDIAWNSDPASGNVIYFTENSVALPPQSLPCTPCGGIGGTSIAAPQLAGFEAIANQAAGKRLGQLAPLLYASGVTDRQTSNCAALHDVTSGNNLGYNAGPGWDFTTGWGSPNAYNLLRILVPTMPPVGPQTRISSPTKIASVATTSGSTVSVVLLPAIYNYC